MIKPMFSDYVQRHLLNYPPLQKGDSENTRASYSHAYLEFYIFYNSIHKIRPDRLGFKDIDSHMVEELCIWLENTKNIPQKQETCLRTQAVMHLHAGDRLYPKKIYRIS